MLRDAKYLITIMLAVGLFIFLSMIPFVIMPIQILAGAIMVMFMPGYAITRALRLSNRIEEIMIFSIGISMIVSVLGGFVLNSTPWGIERRSWAIFLGAVIVIIVIGDIVLNQVPTGTHRFDLKHFHIKSIALVTISLLLFAFAISVAVDGASSEPDPGFTLLWMHPDYVSNSGLVRLGIQNMERQEKQYRLEVYVNGLLSYEWCSLTLEDKQEWQVSVTIPSSMAASVTEARLYLLDNPSRIYRTVRL